MPATCKPEPALPLRIAVVGVGGNGCRAVKHMARSAVSTVKFLSIDTDPVTLAQCRASRPIGISSLTRRTTSAWQAKAAAEQASATIRAALAASDMVIIVAGLADATAIGAAPVVARITQELGILAVAVASLPGAWDGPATLMEQALGGVVDLRSALSTVLVLPSDVLYDKLGEAHVQFPELQVYIDVMVARVTSSLIETTEGQALVDVDVSFCDLQVCLGMAGGTALAMADLHISDLPLVAGRMLACPLQAGVDLAHAQGILVSLRGDRRTLLRAGNVVRTLVREMSSTAHIVIATVRDGGLIDQMQLTMIATGFPDKLP